MRVRMLVPVSGTVDGVRYPRVGEEFDVADAAGAKLCEKSQAEAVVEPEKREKAVAKKAETRKG